MNIIVKYKVNKMEEQLNKQNNNNAEIKVKKLIKANLIIDDEDENNILTNENREKYMKYGSVYGKKYCVKTDYGQWDSEFTIEILEKFICEYYKKLKKGGTLIMFFDIWKITLLKELLEKYKYKQIRFIEWIKTNPQPRNSKVNYLTNCREIALIGIKEGNPTFNSFYDNGIYMFPLQ